MLTSSTSTEICGSDAQGFDFSLKIILNHVWTKDEGDSTDDIDNNLIDSICLSFTPQLKTTSGVDWNLDSSLIDRLVRGRSGGHFSYLSVSFPASFVSQASLIACQASLIAWYEDDLVVVFLTYLVDLHSGKKVDLELEEIHTEVCTGKGFSIDIDLKVEGIQLDNCSLDMSPI
ncbi:hypothetical protein PGT21_030029 [Puccinia graminis f. sp. tritici]|uniref:Uncharacterized protein n=1 Tax=Puccinia graminis f. sp. tritici TaxID=56615 RepID=A0A5B0NZT7_PUCGR|nr:hypothetical protein PGT21_030029 [Puccinia graminis f. sp. tritici]